MLGTAGIGGDEGQVDFGFQCAGKLDLGPFRRVPQSLQGHAVAAEVDTRLLPKLLNQPLKDLLVEVVAAQVGIAVGRLDLKHTFAHLQDGNVKGATAQVEHGYGGVFVGLVPGRKPGKRRWAR